MRSGIIASSYVKESMIDRYLRYLDVNSLPLNFTESSIRDLLYNASDFFKELDVFYLFGVDVNSSMVNLVNPRFFQGIPSETGLSFSENEMKGDGGFLDTTFNPSLVPNNYGKPLKYSLINACRGTVVTSINSAQSNERQIDGISESIGGNAWDNTGGNNLKRINTGTSSNSTSFSQDGVGMKILSRLVDDIFLYQNDTIQSTTNTNRILSSSSQTVLRRGFTYSKLGLGCYFIGGHLTFQISQNFRDAYNQFRIDNELLPIA